MCAPNTVVGRWGQGYLRNAGITDSSGTVQFNEHTMAAFLDPTGALNTYSAVAGAVDVANEDAAKAKKAVDAKAAADEATARALIPPDLTDKAVQEARARQARQLTLGQGRRSTFLTGPQGVTAQKPLGYQTLLGSP